MRKYRELKIWSKGIDIVKYIYELTNQLPNDEKYGLKSQITRAAVSIPSNIAEGCGRDSNKDYKRFLEISLGSVYELSTQLTIIEELNLISSDKLITLKNLLYEEEKC